MNITDFLSKLTGVKPTGEGKWAAQCPAHEDKNPSLSISTGENKIIVYCHAGCSVNSITDALGLKVADLFDHPLDADCSEQKPRKPKRQIEKEYNYHDADGNLVYQVVRMIPKDFRQRRPDHDSPDGWVWNMKGVERVLYRLPKIMAAVRDGKPVIVVEGEKDADNVAALGFTTTCNVGGAGKWRAEYTESLTGADVVILPDKDEVGKNHGDTVAAALCGKARSIRVIYLPGIGKDASNWIDDGGTTEALDAIIAAAPKWKPPTLKPTYEEIDVIEYDLTDTGQADLIADLYHNAVKCDHQKNTDGKRRGWYVWRDKKWRPDVTGEIVRMAQEAAKKRAEAAEKIDDEDIQKEYKKFAKRSANEAGIKAAVSLASCHHRIAVDGTGWDPDPWLLGVANGVIDLRTGDLIESVPDQYITKYSPIEYQGKDAPTPERWEQFIDEVFDNNDDLISFMQKAIGYTLTGITSEQCYFICYGIGGNGKSTLFDVIADILGDHAVTLQFESLEAKRSPNIPTDMAMIRGSRMLKAAEPSSGSRFNDGRIKALTGEDSVTARHLFGQEFTFRPGCKLWLAVNHKPKVWDDSRAYWRRVRLIPFTRQFSPDTDPQMKQKILSEYPQILSWMVRGCTYWQADGMRPPGCVVEATRDYRVENDHFSEFLEEIFIEESGSRTSTGEIFNRYNDWFSGADIDDKQKLTKRTVGLRLSARYNKAKTANSYDYLGLRPKIQAVPSAPGLFSEAGQ